MENITTDIHELEKGMEMTKREYDLRRNSRDQLIILRDFLANSEEKLRKLLSDVKTAQVKFKNTVYPSLTHLQGSHRFEKYLNMKGFLEKSLKMKYALQSTGDSL